MIDNHLLTNVIDIHFCILIFDKQIYEFISSAIIST
uniref:Uncharacterized protein n=1 Tax=viral metagenome TaxID=1070528 RepID=A0A6C0C6Q1_9ZZZZ